MAHQRMVGERCVKQDFVEDIHGLIHSNLVSGEDPTLKLTKPSLSDVNEASLYLQHAAKIQVVPTRAVGTTQMRVHSEGFVDDLEYESEEELVW